MRTIPLEDEFGDVIRKARVGLVLSHEMVSRRAGLPVPELEKAERYLLVPGDEAVRKLAEALDLKATALLDLAHKRYEPATTAFESLGAAAMVSGDYGGGVVNCYAAWDSSSREGAFFDTGVDFAALERLQARHGFEVRHVFVTHTHGDHIAVLGEVQRRWKPVVVAGANEPLRGAKMVERDTAFALGALNVKAFPTPGHSPGGLSFYVEGFGAGRPALCVCGDTLFAGSAGGPMHSYEALMNSVRWKLLVLDDDTILCPGHGSLTTVGGEKRHNPFA
ncbi:MAG: MBL fold metallo-hydrolase [Verrucomicrobia bacterium]|nr:MBL fold metallo-hydrolase [Verrucomicrobiota bacterium]